jgi:hypothetical protein
MQNWVIFLCGFATGVLASAVWKLLVASFQCATELEVARMEVPALGHGLPRALVRSSVDEFYVRQLLPGGRIAWFREDTGAPVSEPLERRLHMALALTVIDARRAV